jgi:hypothetical protein
LAFTNRALPRPRCHTVGHIFHSGLVNHNCIAILMQSQPYLRPLYGVLLIAQSCGPEVRSGPLGWCVTSCPAARLGQVVGSVSGPPVEWAGRGALLPGSRTRFVRPRRFVGLRPSGRCAQLKRPAPGSSGPPRPGRAARSRRSAQPCCSPEPTGRPASLVRPPGPSGPVDADLPQLLSAIAYASIGDGTPVNRLVRLVCSLCSA